MHLGFHHLGPLLFLLFSNDLPEFMLNKTTLFADDTTLIDFFLNSDELRLFMENSQIKASSWFSANKLNLNHSKTTKMILSTRSLDNIENPEQVKFLGIILDSCLNWKSHVDYISGRLCKTI